MANKIEKSARLSSKLASKFKAEPGLFDPPVCSVVPYAIAPELINISIFTISPA